MYLVKYRVIFFSSWLSHTFNIVELVIQVPYKTAININSIYSKYVHLYQCYTLESSNIFFVHFDSWKNEKKRRMLDYEIVQKIISPAKKICKWYILRWHLINWEIRWNAVIAICVALTLTQIKSMVAKMCIKKHPCLLFLTLCVIYRLQLHCLKNR